MTEEPIRGYQPLPLRFVLTPPTSLDEAMARATVASGRMIAQAWGYHQLLESCCLRTQACLLGTAEQLWRHTLEALYLRDTPRTEKIEVL